MIRRSFRVCDVCQWLNQGPAILLAVCDVEGESITLDEVDDVVPTTEKGWGISLLQTGEILTVHEETLTFTGEEI